MTGGEKILLMRDMKLERDTDYQQNGEFPADIVNLDFDSIWLALQQYQADSNRTLKFPIEEQGGQTLNVTAAARAGKALIFDVNGNPTVSDDNYVDQAANAAASAAAALASQQAAAGSQAAAENASGTATVAASQALYYAQHGTGFTAGTAYDLGSVADPLNIFNTDLGSVP
ncbi:hypothetical protein RC54_04010 [Herbaspirillum rubrisubalbicans]|uniref:Uncharacterized protein n=2 Tax=Herbaspirillum rubrisubalbicans TaxID=80842 RepID=A0AAD0U9V3_9BURK|nr:hypothetical protein RC54_04010 [Herbaspirillum rubrisubalbicans]